jgi:hypothetical protein
MHGVAQQRISLSENLWGRNVATPRHVRPKKQISSEVEVSLLGVAIIIDIRYPAHLHSRELTLDVYVTRVQINSRVFLMKTNSQACLAFSNKRLSTLLQKNTIFRAANNEYGWLLQSAEIGCSG